MRLILALGVLAGLNLVAGTSYGADEWYLNVLNAHKKEVFRLEVRWATNDGTQCDLPDSGTGVLLANHGRVVTATHVIKKKDPKPNCHPEVLVYPDAGSSVYYRSRLLDELSNDAVSVIQLIGYDTDTTIKASDSKNLKIGDEVFYMGYPGGSWSWNTGKLTNTNDSAGMFLLEMSSGGGASGAPIFDKCGGVVGVLIGRPDSSNPGQTHFYPLELAASLYPIAVQAPPCGASSRPEVICRVQVEAASDGVVTRSTGWRGGGYNPTAWCNNLLATVSAEQPAAQVSLVPGSAVEDSRDTCPPFNCRQYNYTCSVKVHKDAKYVEQKLPSCP